MRKKIEELVRGDVIRGLIPKKGEHTVIILSDYSPDEHMKCINACSFSSNPSLKKDNRNIELDGVEIPDYFFDIKKPISYLRIDELPCLKKFEIREYKGNLKSHTKLWKKICTSISNVSALATQELDGMCSCSCFDANELEPFYCTQEISHLAPEVLKEYKYHGQIMTCSCCQKIIPIHTCPPLCPYCNDNTCSYLHDFDKNTTEIIIL